MFKQTLLKQLTIMYTEDDINIRESFTPLFEKLFKEVFVAQDGKDGLEQFSNLKSSGVEIDIIISDINMPRMNGLEMLYAIKQIDSKVPFILTTAHSDSEYLIEAIKLGVSHYAVKPINATDLLNHIQVLCEAKYHEKATIAKQKEIEQYLSIINKVAVVSKTDTHGIITYANDIFCEVAGYTAEELIGKPHNIVRHPDMPKEAYKELWETIKSGNIWKGKVKNKAKNGEPYFVNATIFPIFDQYGNDIVEYMAIRFLTTEEENEKREFKKKVIQNIQQTKEKETNYKNQIRVLEDKLKLAENIELIKEFYQKEKDKNSRLQSTIASYEAEISALKQKTESIVREALDRPAKILADYNQLKVKYDYSVSKVKDIETELHNKEEMIIKLNAMLNEQLKNNENLKDVIYHREKQLKDNGIIK